MKEFNVREYTELCLTLLGYSNTTPTDKDFNIYENKTTPIFDKTMIEANFDRSFVDDYRYIMLVVEKIESLKLGNVKIPITFSSMYQGTRTEIEEYYDATVVFRIEHSNCYVDIVGTMRLRNDFIVVNNLPTKREAVIQAIWEFLNWYNEKK